MTDHPQTTDALQQLIDKWRAYGSGPDSRSAVAEGAMGRALICANELEAAKAASFAQHQQEIDHARTAMWLTHGCPIELLYGDDGEMQCGQINHGHDRLIDFKREPLLHLVSAMVAARCKAEQSLTEARAHIETLKEELARVAPLGAGAAPQGSTAASIEPSPLPPKQSGVWRPIELGKE
jgi:cellobiose-specific phosphotransferase system component IIA